MEWNEFVMGEYETELKRLSGRDREVIMPRIRGILGRRIGESSKISGKGIMELLSRDGMVVGDSKVREIIRLLRISGQVKYLCGSSDGYFVAKNHGEMARYLQTNLRPRTRKVYVLWKSMEYQLQEMKEEMTGGVYGVVDVLGELMGGE